MSLVVRRAPIDSWYDGESYCIRTSLIFVRILLSWGDNDREPSVHTDGSDKGQPKSGHPTSTRDWEGTLPSWGRRTIQRVTGKTNKQNLLLEDSERSRPFQRHLNEKVEVEYGPDSRDGSSREMVTPGGLTNNRR